MKLLKEILSFTIILCLCMILCLFFGCVALLIWDSMEAAVSVFLFGTVAMMLWSGQLD